MHFKTPLLIATTACLLLSCVPSHGLERVRSSTESDGKVSLFPLAEPAPSEPVATPDGEPATALELQVAQLLAENLRQQAQLIQLGDRLTRSESTRTWLPLLLLGLGAAGLLASLLAWRVSRLQRQLARQAQVVAAEQVDWQSGPRPDVASSTSIPLFAPAPLTMGRQTTAASVVEVEVDPAATLSFSSSSSSSMAPGTGRQDSRLAPMAPAFSFGTGVPPRPVSVEELLDLDQQVDFFMVLGQPQSAIELLLSHVRTTGGVNALPYFRLLQIYRQQGDEEAYERTRDRFNQRFNAQAPDWQGDLAAGRSLEHYPEVVARLQRAWLQPLRAVAELESLLLRRADLEPFDLPAYHDVLTLHALVRDLPALPALSEVDLAANLAPTGSAARPDLAVAALAESSRSESLRAVGTACIEVDILLPLGEDADDSSDRQPLQRPGAGMGARAMLANWVFARAASPLPAGPGGEATVLSPASLKLDLDLNDFAPAPREFTRPAAFTDVDLRRDSRRSDLAAFDDSDLLPPSTSHR